MGMINGSVTRKPEGIGEDSINMDFEEMHEGWIHLVQNRDQWRALVNTVMNIRYREKAGCFITS
jgi:hypothetical protein